MKPTEGASNYIDELTAIVIEAIQDVAVVDIDDLKATLRTQFSAILNKQKSVWTPPELAAEWSVSPDKILNWIRSGELPATNLATTQSGRPRFRIDQQGIETFKRKRANHSPPPKPTRKRKSPSDVIEFF